MGLLAQKLGVCGFSMGWLGTNRAEPAGYLPAGLGTCALRRVNLRCAQANRTDSGRNFRIAITLRRTKAISTIPCTIANGGSLGGTLGAKACSGGTLRKLWMISTKTLR